MTEAPCSVLEESSSLWSLYQKHVTKISFSFLFRPSCSFADRREVPANREQRKRHTAEQLSVSHESAWRSFPHFLSTSPKLLKIFFCSFWVDFLWGFFFQLNIFWILTSALTSSFMLELSSCASTDQVQVFLASEFRKQPAFSPEWQKIKKKGDFIAYCRTPWKEVVEKWESASTPR